MIANFIFNFFLLPTRTIEYNECALKCLFIWLIGNTDNDVDNNSKLQTQPTDNNNTNHPPTGL